MATDARIGVGEALVGLTASVVRWARRDMSLTSLGTLATLDRAGPQRITDLARAEGVAQPSMTVLVGILERDGLVVRRRDPSDKRVVLIELTVAGTDLVRSRRRADSQALAQLIEKLRSDEIAALLAALPAWEPAPARQGCPGRRVRGGRGKSAEPVTRAGPSRPAPPPGRRRTRRTSFPLGPTGGRGASAPRASHARGGRPRPAEARPPGPPWT